MGVLGVVGGMGIVGNIGRIRLRSHSSHCSQPSHYSQKPQGVASVDATPWLYGFIVLLSDGDGYAVLGHAFKGLYGVTLGFGSDAFGGDTGLDESCLN